MIEGILSGALGIVMTLMGIFLLLKYNHKDLDAENISKSRMDWINNFREEIAVIIATLKTSPSKKRSWR